MRVIYSTINMFSLNQSFYLLDTATGEKELLDQVATEDIAQWVRYRCHEHDIYNVCLYGNKDYLSLLEEKVLEEEMKNYGEAKIKVEVNNYEIFDQSDRRLQSRYS